MHRIDTSTRQVDKFGTGKDGFTEGTPGVTPPTQLAATFFDSVQEELAGVIEGAGITLDATNGQLLAAINTLLLPFPQELAAYTTIPNEGGTVYTIPAGTVPTNAGRAYRLRHVLKITDITDAGAVWTAKYYLNHSGGDVTIVETPVVGAAHVGDILEFDIDLKFWGANGASAPLAVSGKATHWNSSSGVITTTFAGYVRDGVPGGGLVVDTTGAIAIKHGFYNASGPTFYAKGAAFSLLQVH